MLHDVYIDESSQTKHRFLLLGGLIIQTGTAALFQQRAAEARIPDLPANEIGWVKVSRGKLAAYKRFVEVFFDGQDQVVLEFHAIAVDTHKLDHRRFNGNSREVGFNKEIYQVWSSASKRHL